MQKYIVEGGLKAEQPATVVLGVIKAGGLVIAYTHAAGRTKNSGLKGAGAAKAKQPRTECVWRNKRAVELSKEQKGLLF